MAELHPQLEALLTEIATANYPDQIEVPVDEARRITVERAQRFYGPAEPVHRVEQISIPGPAGPLNARLYAVEADGPLPIVVYLHGGGWVLGDCDSHDKGVRALTNAAQCLSVSVDYRLAPENPFPAAIDDCFGALRWVAENAASLGGDPSRIAVAGDSAGGNLAAACALLAKAEGGPALAFQLLIYPVLDSDLTTESYCEHADALVLNRARMEFFWDRYVPDVAMRTDWRAAPLRAPDLSGLPPALIIGSGLDPLYSEGVAYAERLRAAGVETEHLPFPRMAHAFFQAPALLDDSRAAIDRAGIALRTAFGTLDSEVAAAQ
jgi:acetyl esterase